MTETATIDADELARKLALGDAQDGGDALTVLDVRSAGEYDGTRGYACDERQGHIPGARHLHVDRLTRCETVDEVRELVGLPEGAQLVAYCHSGSRSALAVRILHAAGYHARNYEGSWHEWSRRGDLPLARDEVPKGPGPDLPRAGG